MKNKTTIVWGTLLVIVMFFLVCGFRVSYVVSGSMNPTIPKGSAILTKSTDGSKVKNNDIVLVWSDAKQKTICHRVIHKTNKYVITKGDANKEEDEMTLNKNVTAKYIAHIPYVGYALQVIHNYMVLLIVMIVAGAFVIALAKRKKGE